jgi:hypothetical protein
VPLDAVGDAVRHAHDTIIAIDFTKKIILCDETARKLVRMSQENFVKVRAARRCRRALGRAGGAHRGGIDFWAHVVKKAADEAAFFRQSAV